MTAPSEVVHEFEVGRLTIRASLTQLRNGPHIDLRSWFEPSPGAALLPTKKGLCVPADFLDELGECLDACRAALKKTGKPSRGKTPAATGSTE